MSIFKTIFNWPNFGAVSFPYACPRAFFLLCLGMGLGTLGAGAK